VEKKRFRFLPTVNRNPNTKKSRFKAKYNPLDPNDNPYTNQPAVDPYTREDEPADTNEPDACWNEIRSIFPPSAYGHVWDNGRELFDDLVADGIDLQWLMTQVYRYVESVAKKDPQHISPIQRWFSQDRYKKELPKTFMETHSEFMANQYAQSAKYREEQARKDAPAQPTPEEMKAIMDRAEADWLKGQG